MNGYMKHETIGTVNIYNCDCMEFMAGLPDNAYDLAIVDPPYGIGAGDVKFKNGTSKTEKPYYKINDWDKTRPTKQYFDELRRVSKNQIVFGGNYFADILGSFRCFVFWDKTIHGNSYADGELAWCSFDSVARYFRENIAQTNSEGRIHPTQKSILLYRFLLKEFAIKGDRILDTHFGSGSHGVADLGFSLDACELDTDYFTASVERIRSENQQIKLFDAPTQSKAEQIGLDL